MHKNNFKSIGAVLAGLIMGVVLSNGTGTILEAIGVFPPVDVQRDARGRGVGRALGEYALS